MKLSSKLFQDDWKEEVPYRALGQGLEWLGRRLVFLNKSDFEKKSLLLFRCKALLSLPGVCLRALASCDKPLFQISRSATLTQARKELKVLTLNTACLPSGISTYFNHLRSSETRANEIANAIMNAPYDVICFQELFSEECFRIISQTLSSKYGWSVHHAGSAYIGFNSGLAIFSKYPIVHADFQKFRSLVGEDRFTNKGFLCADIQVGAQSVRVYTTHTQSGGYPKWLKSRFFLGTAAERRKPHFEAIRKHMQFSKTDTVIVTGDFNMNLLDARAREEQGPRFFALFREYVPQPRCGTSLKREWLKQHREHKYMLLDAPIWDAPTYDRVIDGVLVTKSSKVKSVDTRIVSAFTNSTDHLGVEATIEF